MSPKRPRSSARQSVRKFSAAMQRGSTTSLKGKLTDMITGDESADHVNIDDFVAISNLLGQYQWYVDERNCDGWASLFVENGVFESAFTGEYRGHSRLRLVPEETWQMFSDR